jgi:hypothetical protein
MDNDQYPKEKGDKSGQINFTRYTCPLWGNKMSKQGHKPHKVFLNALRYFIIVNSDMRFQAS